MKKNIIIGAFAIFALFMVSFQISSPTIKKINCDDCITATVVGMKNNFGRWEQDMIVQNACSYRIKTKVKMKKWTGVSWEIIEGGWGNLYHEVVVSGYSNKTFYKRTTDDMDDIKLFILSSERY